MTADLELIQQGIEAALKANGPLSQLPILREDRRDLISEIETSLNKLGLCIIVQTVAAEVSKPNLPGPVYSPITVSVQVHENPIINRATSDTNAIKTAQAVASALHHRMLTGSSGPLVCLGIFYQPDSRVLTYSVDFKIGD